MGYAIHHIKEVTSSSFPTTYGIPLLAESHERGNESTTKRQRWCMNSTVSKRAPENSNNAIIQVHQTKVRSRNPDVEKVDNELESCVGSRTMQIGLEIHLKAARRQQVAYARLACSLASRFTSIPFSDHALPWSCFASFARRPACEPEYDYIRTMLYPYVRTLSNPNVMLHMIPASQNRFASLLTRAAELGLRL
jgi:hypothetical protein